MAWGCFSSSPHLPATEDGLVHSHNLQQLTPLLIVVIHLNISLGLQLSANPTLVLGELCPGLLVIVECRGELGIPNKPLVGRQGLDLVGQDTRRTLTGLSALGSRRIQFWY